jgi:hypothetical protein
MTDSLIVVEGSLRLPPLRPLADPSLRYGREWLPARNRPVQTPSEVPLFAAHMQTAYLVAITLSGMGSSYRAASIWAVFTDTAPDTSLPPQAQAVSPGSNTAPPSADASQPKAYALLSPEPILLNVNTPTPAVVVAPPPVAQGMSVFVKIAIVALACAALLSWLSVAQEKICAGQWNGFEPFSSSVKNLCQSLPAFLR